ncbi:MAG: DUF192 domain-containing protein [Marinobacter sp.]|uniref:DUF192 domain-containing protein n=1 Tax=Marinobacter sp. TaxID=50741 RepID=UPI00396EA149
MAAIRWASLVLAFVLVTGCGVSATPAQSDLPMADACFVTDSDSVPVVLEVASTSEQRQVGLMGRTELPASHGMLFRYEEQREPKNGFWMYRTLIPMDIAFLDREGTIRNIRTMVPCSASQGRNCPIYPAGVHYWSAVEMNAGFYLANGVEVGDRLVLDGENCRAKD